MTAKAMAGQIDDSVLRKDAEPRICLVKKFDAQVPVSGESMKYAWSRWVRRLLVVVIVILSPVSLRIA
jgi:hypothetical protein